MVYQGIDSAGQAIGGVEKRLGNLDEARMLMAVTTKDVRTATRLQAGTSPFVLANKREVIFYANLNNDGSSGSVVDNGPRRVRIYVDTNNQLIEEVVKPDASSVPPAYTYTGAAARRYVGPLRRERGQQPDLPLLRRQRRRAHVGAALGREPPGGALGEDHALDPPHQHLPAATAPRW